MSAFSDIIDNRHLNLKNEVNDKLTGSASVKFAVGYLYLSGFYQIAEKLAELKEVRLLIGSNLNRELIEALAESLPGDDEIENEFRKTSLQRPSERDEVKENISRSIVNNIQALPHTVQRQKEIATLTELIHAKKVQVKVYTKHPLHAKAYIFKYKEESAKIAASEGIAIVGSSNLTMSGFHHNTELNTYVRGQKNYEELNTWFDQLWDEATPFEEALESTLKESWAIKTVNPYDIYILTLYHLTKTSLEKQASQIWFWENPEYMARLIVRFKNMKELYQFQKVAISQAYHWVHKYNGVFISDVVGLGKTYIGSGLLKQLNRRALIISPPGLVEMWEEFVEKFEIDGKVVSRGMLYNETFDKKSVLWQYRDREVVLVDESHHFRNNDTKMYRELQPFLLGKKTILMTATPQNTSVWNIYNQLKLFCQTEENIFPNKMEEPHLKNLFKKVENHEYRLPDLLKHIVIRRTRKHITQFYSGDGLELVFPKRELETVRYDINETYQDLYSKIRQTLRQLKYARYDLWQYVKEEKKEIEPYVQLKKVIGTLRIFHKINLFKRLESSIFAFRKSIDTMLSIHQKFLRIITEKQIIPAGAIIQDRLYRYDLEDIWDDIEDLSDEYRAEDFEIDKLIIDLRHDISVFTKIQSDLNSIPEKQDTKYDRLKASIHVLRNKEKQRKVLLFSEYADTVDYLESRLVTEYENVSKVHGGTPDNANKIKAFAPKANDYDGNATINLMVASDVLSEGHNLQDCSVVINYDLHWNPVRLIQRAGRVDRIGSKADKILIKNFLPTDEVEKEIMLTQILEHRIKEIHEHIGEDERILYPDEQINESAMYAIYQDQDIDTLEEEDARDFTSEEAEHIIKALQRDNPEYMALIKKMQLGLRSAKSSTKLQGTYAFFSAGDFGKLLVKKNDQTIIDDFAEVMNEILCSPDEQEVIVNEARVENYFDDVNDLKQLFSKQTVEENFSMRIDPEVRKAQKRIQTMIGVNRRVKEFIETASRIDKILNAYFPNHLLNELRRLNKLEKDDERWFEEIVNLYNRENLGESAQKSGQQEKSRIEFICGEILKRR